MKKFSDVISTKEKVGQMVVNARYSPYRKEVTNMVLSMNVMNTMNRACGQQGSFNENRYSIL